MSVRLRERTLKDGRTSLYFDIWQDGRRYYEALKLRLPTGREERKEMIRFAEELRAKRELELLASLHGYIPRSRQKSSFLDFFGELAQTRHKTWKTVLLQLREFSGDHLAFNQINGGWLDSFQDYLLARVSPNSANVYLHKIKTALTIAVKRGILPANPCQSIAIVKTQPTERTFLTFEEVQQLSNTPTDYPEIKRAFLFACYTGLRLSDVKRLTGAQIVSGQLQFRQKKTGGFEYLPLSSTALKLLEPVPMETNRPIFRLPKSEGGLWTHLQIWVTRAGIQKHVSFHVSRHTFATLALRASKDLYVVSKLLGHKDIKHTQIYAKIVDDHKMEAVNMMPQLQ